MFKLFVGVGNKIEALFVALFGVILLLLAFKNMERVDMGLYKYAAVYLLVIFISSVLVLKIKHKRIFLLGLVILSLSLRIIWILIVNTTPVSDFSLLNNAANLILNGELSTLKGIDYFNVWVYQLGFSVYCSFLYFIFGSSIFVVKIFNVLFSTGTVVLIYFIALRIFNDKAARISSLLYGIYIQSVIFNSLLTNQVVSAFFIYLGILIIMYKSRWTYYLISGISIAIGHIMRPEGSFALYIVVAAIVFYNILDFLRNKGLFHEKSESKSSYTISMLSKAAILVLTFNIVVLSFGYSLKASGITDYNFGNRNVYWKFVIGLNRSTDGGYSNEDVKILNKYPVGEELYNAEKAVILERIKNKYELAAFMKKKFKIMWTNNDNTIQFVSQGTNLTDREMYYIIGWEKIQYTVMLFLACLSVFLMLKNKNSNLYLFIIMLLISANFAVYLLVEIQTRYRYFIMPAFFILSGYSLFKVMEFISIYIKNLRKKLLPKSQSDF